MDKMKLGLGLNSIALVVLSITAIRANRRHNELASILLGWMEADYQEKIDEEFEGIVEDLDL